MATRIGTAYIEVDADPKKFMSGLSTMKRGLGGLVKGVGLVGTAILGLGATVGALAARAGIDRALNIEDARGRLLGLKHTVGEVDAIMEDALQSVLGTSFRLDEAAGVAAGAVAAGIKPGVQLRKFLALTADAAFEAGTSMKEMGSIFVRDQATGRIYTRDLNQLATRGIPVYSMLAEAYGVTTLKLREMVKDGKIQASDYRRVLNEGFGKAAQQMGETTRGAYKNMGAAMARFGSEFVQPLLPIVKDVFYGITQIWDDLTLVAGDFVKKMLKLKPFQWMIDQAKNIPETFQKIKDALFGVEGQIQTLTNLPRPDWESMGPSTGLIERLKTTFQPIIDGIVRMFRLFKRSRREGDSFGTALIQALEKGVKQVLRWINNGGLLVITEEIIKSLDRRTEFFTAVLNLFRTILEALPSIIENISKWAQSTLLPALSDIIGEVLPELFRSLIFILTEAFMGIDKMLPQLIKAVKKMLYSFSRSLKRNGPMLARAAGDMFITLIEGLGVVLPLLVHVISHDLIPLIADVLIRTAPALINAAADLFTALLDGLNIVIPLLAQLLVTMLNALIVWFQDNKATLIPMAVTFFEVILDGLRDVIIPLGEVLLSELIPAILEILTAKDTINSLVDAAIILFLAISYGLADSIPVLLRRITEPGGLIDLLSAKLSSKPVVDALFDASMILFSKFVLALGQSVIDIVKFVDEDFRKDIGEALQALWDNFYRFGANLFGQIWEGMKDIWYNDVLPWVNDMITLFNKALPEQFEVPVINIERGEIGDIVTGEAPNFNQPGYKPGEYTGAGGRRGRGGSAEPPAKPPPGVGGEGYAGGLSLETLVPLGPTTNTQNNTQNITVHAGAVQVNNPKETVDVESAVYDALADLASVRKGRGAFAT